MSAELQALYGTDEPLPEATLLTAGPLTALFTGGALRSIRLQGVEVVRGIYFLIRDRNWATVVPELKDVEVNQQAGGFTVTFACDGTTPAGNHRLVWRGKIEGSAADGIRFEAAGAPETDLVTGRTGFIVLHPLERVVGCPVTIEHSDGTSEATSFPDLVDPLQSFFDIRAMTHEPVPGIRATVRMEGDEAWETEDHRNWLDASFKTYFRPLGLPWPYTIPAGQEIRQAITIEFAPSIADLKPVPAEHAVTVAVGDRTGAAMPEIGLAVNPDELDASLAVASEAATLAVQTLAVRVSAGAKDLPGILRKAALLARALGAEPVLEVVLPLARAYEIELDLVATAAASAGLVPRAVVVSPEIDLKSYPPSVDRPPSPPLDPIYEAARRVFPRTPLGGGMFSYFTELNRRRVPAHRLDFVQHATASIVHAADDRSVMETLESLPHVFRSARAFIAGKPYHVGPVNIGMGFNPYGETTTPNPDRLKRTMVTEDPRADAQFGAAWVTGYLARAVAGGLAGVTLMAPAGPFGVLGTDGPRPAFHVVQSFAAAFGAPVLACASSRPQAVLACACMKGARSFVWLANITAEPQTVTLTGVTPIRTRMLAGGKLTTGELTELPPFAVAFVEA